MAAGAKLPPLADEMKPPRDPAAQQRGIFGKAKRLAGDGAAIVVSGIAILFSGVTPNKGQHGMTPSGKVTSDATMSRSKAATPQSDPAPGFIPPGEPGLQPHHSK